MMSPEERGRRIKVEVRGLSENRYMMMYISEKMKRIGDLEIKLRFLCNDIDKTDKLTIYRDKFLLPRNENISIIQTDEEITVLRKAAQQRVGGSNDNGYLKNKEDLLKKEEHLKKKQEYLKKKEEELRNKEVELKNKEEELNSQNEKVIDKEK